MLKGEQILCVGFPKWEGQYMKSTVQLMTELALENNLIYVDYPYTWKDTFQASKQGNHALHDRLRARRIVDRLEYKRMKNGALVKVLTLKPFIPANWSRSPKLYELLTRYNGRKNLSLIQKVLKQFDFKNPIVINAFNPALGRVWAGKLNEKILVYYCYDEISAAPWIKNHGMREEEAFMKKVDLIITSSTHLQKNKAKYNPNCFTVKNGVNFELFGKPNAKPIFLKPMAKAIVGYLGSVDNRLDYQLLKPLIEKHSDKHFLFVGRINSKEGEYILSQLSNVTLAGPQPIDRLPDWVASFDVGIIPFEKNKLTASIYPLKINEYLAQGIPVVTTSFSDLSDFTDQILIADTVADFGQAMDNAIQQNQPTCKEKRRQTAFQNSWPKRAEQFGQIIQNHIQH